MAFDLSGLVGVLLLRKFGQKLTLARTGIVIVELAVQKLRFEKQGRSLKEIEVDFEVGLETVFAARAEASLFAGPKVPRAPFERWNRSRTARQQD